MTAEVAPCVDARVEMRGMREVKLLNLNAAKRG